MTEIWTGWKEICKQLKFSERTIKRAFREMGLPIKYPFGRPQLTQEEFIEWFKNLPPGLKNKLD